MMADDVVGCLEVHLAGEDSLVSQDLIDVHGNEQFYLGRNPALCERHWLDPTISNKHLQIHCILYDESGGDGVPPLVYATDVSSNGTLLTKNNTACATSLASCEVFMTRKRGAFLLSDGDELRISDSVTLIYRETEPHAESPLTKTQEKEVSQFASRYLVTGRLLGKGGFGKVVIGIHQKSQRQLACKVVNVRESCRKEAIPNLRLPTGGGTQPSVSHGSVKRWPSKVTRCSREFKILQNLSHPNIISIEKVFWSSNTIYLFQELITGGDLFSYMERKGRSMNSIDAAVIILQILKAIDYLHDRDIVHRDLKPDNILLSCPDDGARIVLTDFGSARVMPKATTDERRRMFTKTGTMEYIAPEVYEMNKTCPKGSGYTKAVDMWSIGGITASLLSNEALFAASCYEPDPHTTILALAAKCDISIVDDDTHAVWSKIGNKPKDFIKNLLVLREEDRMSVKEALKHSWFTNPYLAEEFEALYARSIRDWQPRRTVPRLVELIAMPMLDEEPLLQTRSQCFQRPSVRTSFPQFQERFIGSQDWNLSVVYPPSEEESVAAEHEEAQYEGPSRYDQHSFELGTRSGHDGPHPSSDASTSQLSLELDPPASDMYSIHTCKGHDYHMRKENKAGHRPVIFSRPSQDHDAPIDSPVPYPPLTLHSPEPDMEKRISFRGSSSSIINETPISYSQLKELACYGDIYRCIEQDVEHDRAANSHKRRKLAQACP